MEDGKLTGLHDANSVMASAKRLMEVRNPVSAIAEWRRSAFRVADTDPPHEIDDGKSHATGSLRPNADALIEQPGGSKQQPCIMIKPTRIP